MEVHCVVWGWTQTAGCRHHRPPLPSHITLPASPVTAPLTFWYFFIMKQGRVIKKTHTPISPSPVPLPSPFPPVPLPSPSMQNNFERAQTDVFAVKGTDIGDVQRVVVWHDNSGPGPAWHLQQVCVWEGGRGQEKGRPWCFRPPQSSSTLHSHIPLHTAG